MTDQPFVDYKTGEKKEVKHTRQEMDELSEKWRKMKEENGDKSLAEGWSTQKVDDILKE